MWYDSNHTLIIQKKVNMSVIPTLPRSLGNGLLLRRSTAADAAALADFNRLIHRDPGVVEPDEGVAAWTRDLLRGDHPTFGVDDFTIVEEQATGKIVSSLNLISQTWAYAGIPFKVGRPELVGTDPAYRKHGLIRTQFEVAHAWSAARGELVQAITGIPYFYRQFGYEMAMMLGGGRRGYPAEFPPLKPDQTEPYRIRPVAAADLPFVMAVDAHAARRSLISCVRDEALGRYELFGKSPGNVNGPTWAVVETAEGEPAGVVAYGVKLEGGRLPIFSVELKPGLSWLKVTPSLLRGLAGIGAALAAGQGKALAALAFWLGVEHPLFTVAEERLPHVRRPYAWYLRVARDSVPGFLWHIAPALEERLAGSVAAGHSGELKLSFYRDGVRLVFEAGRLVVAEPWQPNHDDGGAAGFPGRTFLQLLFGYRTLAELRTAFPDCWADGDDARTLLEVLFPKQPSSFWPVA